MTGLLKSVALLKRFEELLILWSREKIVVGDAQRTDECSIKVENILLFGPSAFGIKLSQVRL
jgi:hypothetical protein